MQPELINGEFPNQWEYKEKLVLDELRRILRESIHLKISGEGGKFKKFDFPALPTDFLCITFSQDPTGSVQVRDFAISPL